MRIERVGIAGLGLIGGSLGMALTGSGRFDAVMGFDAAAGVGETALAAGAVTEIVSAVAGLAAAEVIIVATPVQAVVPTVAALAPYLRRGTIVTDTASTKTGIVAAAVALIPEGTYFVGGHPFAGSERAGIAAADAYLFENAAYVLTDAPHVPGRIYDELKTVLSCTGAKFLALTPEEHDLIAAGVSHLPHLVAAALVNTAGALEAKHPGALTLAGGGFRDTTRIAGGDAALWSAILGSNREPLLAMLDLFQAELLRFSAALAADRGEDLAAGLAAAHATRAEVPARGKGLIGRVEELVVAVQDRPGAIKQVLDVLSHAGINVKDIEILHLREGEGGTLRVAVEGEEALSKAVALLREARLGARRR